MIDAEWLGLVPYADALTVQRDRREQVIAGDAPEVLLAMEHPPVITLGRRAVDPGTIDAGEVPVIATERGGLATWHGPGQLVVYAIVAAERRGIGARRLVTALESGVISWLSTRGIVAGGRAEARGVWVGDEKICAVGLHLRHGVSMHGLALNLRPALDGFARIVPCGLAGFGVTSVEKVLGEAPSAEGAWEEVCAHLSEALRIA